MNSSADEDDALSELDDDLGEGPVVLSPVSNATSFKAVLAQLESERQSRKDAEASKLELQSSFTRLKAFTQEAVKQRDEAVRHKEETQKWNEELSKRLSEAVLLRDEAIRQRDESTREKDEAVRLKDDACRQIDDASKARDSFRSEIEVAARLLVLGAQTITSKVSSIKSFPGRLPRSPSHTGVAAIAYGFTKRAELIVDELLKHQEGVVRNRSEMREQLEQRNYQIAIEISELEARIHQLNNDLSQKSLEIEKWQTLAADKEGRISKIEQEMSHKLAEAEKETEASKNAAQVAQGKIDKLKTAMLDLSRLIFKANEALVNITDSSATSQPRSSYRSLVFSSNRVEPEEGVQDCINRLKEVLELCLKLGATWKEHRELRKKEMDDLEGTITRLIIEKKEITNFLKSALANKQEVLEAVSKSSVDSNHNINTAAKHWETKNESSGSDSDRSRLPSGLGRTETPSGDELKTGETIGMASALENEVRSLRQEIFELQQFLAAARGEMEWLKVTSERQTKELSDSAAKLQELKEKQSLAQENIEGLSMDLAVAEEEAFRWKQAATKEAEAGATVLEEVERCQEEVTILREQIKQLSQSLQESNSKLHLKEEMAFAAIAAQNAAERSLRIADERAVQLRERIEEMTRQFEALEGAVDGGVSVGLFDTCWPYKWLKGRLPHLHATTARGAAEMEELLDPLV